MSEAIRMTLSRLILVSPSLLIYICGIVLALILRRRYPRPCLFVLIASCLMLLDAVAANFLQSYCLLRMIYLPHFGASMTVVMTALNFAGSTIHALGLGLLMVAIFNCRQPSGAGEAA